MVTQQPYEDFLTRYADLRAALFDDPHNLIRWEQVSAEQDRIAQDLHVLTREFSMRETFGGRRKIVEYVPSSFKEAWSDYLKRWSSFVDYYVDNMKGVDELLISPPQVYTDEMLPRGETRFVYPLHKPNPECEAEFDPAIHDGRNIYEMAETLLANCKPWPSLKRVFDLPAGWMTFVCLLYTSDAADE